MYRHGLVALVRRLAALVSFFCLAILAACGGGSGDSSNSSNSSMASATAQALHASQSQPATGDQAFCDSTDFQQVLSAVPSGGGAG